MFEFIAKLLGHLSSPLSGHAKKDPRLQEIVNKISQEIDDDIKRITKDPDALIAWIEEHGFNGDKGWIRDYTHKSDIQILIED